jgi:hypothetical protein
MADPMQTFDPTFETKRLARFVRAIAGRRMSGEMACQVNEVLGTKYHEMELLRKEDRAELQAFVDGKLAEGIQPAASLLTPHQQAAQHRRHEEAEPDA